MNQQRKQRAKNRALLIILISIVVLFYGLAIVRIKFGH